MSAAIVGVLAALGICAVVFAFVPWGFSLIWYGRIPNPFAFYIRYVEWIDSKVAP